MRLLAGSGIVFLFIALGVHGVGREGSMPPPDPAGKIAAPDAAGPPGPADSSAPAEQVVPTGEARRPAIEVAFVLDTTGSMRGLIEGAKRKIWSIANELLRGKPTPELRIALVGFRDRGDEYVTRVHDFTDDLDKVYADLMAFQANGGGDTPEHVNRALHEAVHELRWGTGRDVLKVVYLVGDSPPHMDYDDGYDYHKITEDAVRADIVIHTVRCGGNAETEKIWQEIARSAEGRYTSIAQSGGMVAVRTPFDERLGELNRRLNATVLAYGRASEVHAARGRLSLAERAEGEEAAGRASALARAPSAVGGERDLVRAHEEGKVDLAGLKPEELPPELKDKKPEEIETILKEKAAEREKVIAEIQKISKERDGYVREYNKKHAGEKRDAFDEWVVKSVREGAAKKGIRYDPED